jgi:hypothetical protein
MAIREGKWRCPYCSIVNRGASMACPGCGASRDEDVAFFLEDDAPEVTDEALLARARAGADWRCRFCGASYPPALERCGNCGAEQVKAGRRDLGNGFFEDVYRDEPIYRERPVYRTRVSYDVQRWVPDRSRSWS